MTNKKKEVAEPQNAWEYTDWLHDSGRITVEEHIKLRQLLFKLENESSVDDFCFCDEGC
jgi:hypothetical protein